MQAEELGEYYSRMYFVMALEKNYIEFDDIEQPLHTQFYGEILELVDLDNPKTFHLAFSQTEFQDTTDRL